MNKITVYGVGIFLSASYFLTQFEALCEFYREFNKGQDCRFHESRTEWISNGQFYVTYWNEGDYRPPHTYQVDLFTVEMTPAQFKKFWGSDYQTALNWMQNF